MVYINGSRKIVDPELEKKVRLIESMEAYAGQQLELLTPIDQQWQPSDFLPDSTREDFFEKVGLLRENSKAIPDDLLVVLIGDMVTEEALPSYQTMLNRFAGVEDPSGDHERPWALWSRGWTAEENRHGDLLNRFLYLSGRVDMRSIEVTIQYLLAHGFNPGIDNDPYNGFIYTSFQERATKISHMNVAKLARKSGIEEMKKICHTIASDESRHEEAYKRFMDKIFELDPQGALESFMEMMRKTITMPARLMHDGQDLDLFDKFEAIAQRLGVYTAHDYTEIIEHLVQRWNIGSIPNLSDEAAKAQDYLCNLADRYRKIADRMQAKIAKINTPLEFSWIFNRAV